MHEEITPAKIRAMNVGDSMTEHCTRASELEAAYQSAIPVIKEITDKDIRVSKSNVTETVTVRRFK